MPNEGRVHLEQREDDFVPKLKVIRKVAFRLKDLLEEKEQVAT